MRRNISSLDESIEAVRKAPEGEKAAEKKAKLKLLRDLVELQNGTLLAVKTHLLGRGETGTPVEPEDYYSKNPEVEFERAFCTMTSLLTHKRVLAHLFRPTTWPFTPSNSRSSEALRLPLLGFRIDRLANEDPVRVSASLMTSARSSGATSKGAFSNVIAVNTEPSEDISRLTVNSRRIISIASIGQATSDESEGLLN
jgi:hypothetical protein